ATKEKFAVTATARHFNDSIETFFINMLRGTGISGLVGIRSKSLGGSWIRPLLFANRNDIVTFAKAEHLSFRNDSSNDTDNYLRNRIRHHLTPLLMDLNPHFETVMRHNMKKMEFVESVFNEKIRAVGDDFLHFHLTHPYFKRSELKREKYPAGMID